MQFCPVDARWRDPRGHFIQINWLITQENGRTYHNTYAIRIKRGTNQNLVTWPLHIHNQPPSGQNELHRQLIHQLVTSYRPQNPNQRGHFRQDCKIGIYTTKFFHNRILWEGVLSRTSEEALILRLRCFSSSAGFRGCPHNPALPSLASPTSNVRRRQQFDTSKMLQDLMRTVY